MKMTRLIKAYLPDFKMKNTLHPDNPISMGCFGMPEIYTEAQMNREAGVQGSYSLHTQRLGGVG